MATEKIDALELDITSKLTTDNIDKLVASMDKLSNALNKVNTKQVSDGLNDIGDSSNKVTQSFLNQKIQVAAVIAALKGLSDTISDGIALSTEYIGNLNVFNTSLGRYAANAEKYANTVSDVLGIDPSNWMKTQGVMDTLIEGLGVGAEQAAYMSQNLTQLVYDISSFRGISVEQAAQKIKSAVSGEIEPARNLGYDLSQAQLTAIAQNPKYYGKATYSVNENTGALEANNVALADNTARTIANFNQLTQAEKVQLRYIALMTQNTQAQGNWAKTLNDPNTQLKVFQEQLNQTSRALGNVFIPALNKCLPYITAFVELVGDAFNALATFFGFELPDMSDRMDISDEEPYYENVVKATGRAAKNAKKIKDYMLGIDELNVFRPDEPTSGGGGSGKKNQNALGNIFASPGYDFLSKAVKNSIKEAKDAWNLLKKDFEKNPLITSKAIVEGGMGELGSSIWSLILGKSPEEFGAEAANNGRTLGQQFVLSWNESISSLGEKPFDKLLGDPKDLGVRAANAGREVGKQFALELYISIMEMWGNYFGSSGKSFFKMLTGKDFDQTLSAFKSQVSPQTPYERPNNPISGNTAADEARKRGEASLFNISSITLQAGEAGTTVRENFNKAVQADLNGTKKAGEKLVGAAISGVSSSGQKFYNTSAEEARKYGEGLLNSGDKYSVMKYANKLAEDGVTGVSSVGAGAGKMSYAYAAGVSAENYYKNLYNPNSKANAYNAGKNLANQGLTGAKAHNTGFEGAGKNAGQGFVLGIDKNKSSAKTSGETLAKAVLNRLKEVLQIHSPSRKFGEAGMYSVVGYANSVRDNTYMATNAVENMAKSVLSVANTDLSGTLANPLSGNRVAMSGTNVGYGIGMSNDNALATFATQMYQAIASGMSGVGGANGDIKVIIDGKEVFKAVQTQARRNGVAIGNGAFA